MKASTLILNVLKILSRLHKVLRGFQVLMQFRQGVKSELFSTPQKLTKAPFINLLMILPSVLKPSLNIPARLKLTSHARQKRLSLQSNY